MLGAHPTIYARRYLAFFDHLTKKRPDSIEELIARRTSEAEIERWIDPVVDRQYLQSYQRGANIQGSSQGSIPHHLASLFLQAGLMDGHDPQS